MESAAWHSMTPDFVDCQVATRHDWLADTACVTQQAARPICAALPNNTVSEIVLQSVLPVYCFFG